MRGNRFEDSYNRQLQHWFAENSGDHRVLVLAANVKHACRLALAMPTSRLYITQSTSVHNTIERLPFSEQRRSRIAWQIGPTTFESDDLCVATLDQMRALNLEDYSVVVWAGGGSKAQALLPWWNTAATANSAPVLLIDFTDRFNDYASRWSRYRARGYRRSGIYPVGTSSTAGRIEDFNKRQDQYRRLSQ